jgi:hypothetical protein
METLLKSQDFKAMFCFTEAETYNSRLQSEIFLVTDKQKYGSRSNKIKTDLIDR